MADEAATGLPPGLDGRPGVRRAALLLTVLLATASCTSAPGADPSSDAAPPPRPLGWLDADEVRAAQEELAADALRDTGPAAVPLPQVAPGPREQVPSALEDPTAAGLPAPSIDLAQLIDGGQPPDGIPALDAPTFQRTADVHWVDGPEQVLAVEAGGEVRGYPVQVLTQHEIVNDTVGGVPVAVTYCPLCGSGLAFDRRLGDRVLSFGTSGRLHHSDLVMYDRQTESLWPQIAGHAVAGALTGAELARLPAQMVSWDQWRQAHPDEWVLSRQTGYARSYGANPYYGYDTKASMPLFLPEVIDNRIEWLKQPVVGIEVDGDALAVDVEALQEDGVRAVTVGGRELTVWWLPGARSSLDGFAVGDGREVGTVAVFRPEVDGQVRTFRPAPGGGVVDDQTGSTWNAFGEAVSGPSQGSRLVPQDHLSTFWFAWRGFHEGTRVLR